MRRARELWVMRRPSSVPLPELVLPRDVSIRSYRDSDAEGVIAVNAAAFAAHPEQGHMDADNLAERMGEPWFDPAGLLLAVDTDGTLLGFHWTKRHDERLGEVYVVGISPAAQGRGLGRLLTLAGLHHLVASGVDEVLLYTESDNAPAVHVYSGLGFDHAAEDTHVQYHAEPSQAVSVFFHVVGSGVSSIRRHELGRWGRVDSCGWSAVRAIRPQAQRALAPASRRRAGGARPRRRRRVHP